MVSTGMPHIDLSRKDRLDTFSKYVAVLPWFNIDVLHKLYINFYEPIELNLELSQDDRRKNQLLFDQRAITCADLIHSPAVKRINTNIFTFLTPVHEQLKADSHINGETRVRIGEFMLSYAFECRDHFLGLKYLESYRIEANLLIDPNAEAGRISKHIVNRFNQVKIDSVRKKSVEYFLEILNRENIPAEQKELVKLLEGYHNYDPETGEIPQEWKDLDQEDLESKDTVSVKLSRKIKDAILEKISERRDATIDPTSKLLNSLAGELALQYPDQESYLSILSKLDIQFDEPKPKAIVADVWQRIVDLVLNENRLVDLVLMAIQQNPENRTYLDILIANTKHVEQYFDRRREGLTEEEALQDLLSLFSLSQNTFRAQAEKRDNLVAILKDRLSLKAVSNFEDFFEKYYTQMNEFEMTIHYEVREYTEFTKVINQSALDICVRYSNLGEAIDTLSTLVRHYQAWLNKYNDKFLKEAHMCVVYVGVKEGIPFPGGVEKKIKNYLISLDDSTGDYLKLIDQVRTSGADFLSINNQNLNHFPPEIFELGNQIRTLDLSNNKIEQIPNDIYKMKGLESLILSNNEITLVHENIGDLTQLRELELDNNPLEQFPMGILNLEKLDRLSIKNCKLKFIPIDLKEMRELFSYDVSGNPIVNMPIENHDGLIADLVNAYEEFEPLEENDRPVIIAVDLDYDNELPNGKREVDMLFEIAQRIGKCDFIHLDNPTAELLTNRLYQYRDRLSILHIVAIRMDQLTRTEGEERHTIDAHEWVDFFHCIKNEPWNAGLLFLNCCDSEEILSPLLQRLFKVGIGVPALVDDQLAFEVAREFYSSLAEGKTIEESFDETRIKFID